MRGEHALARAPDCVVARCSRPLVSKMQNVTADSCSHSNKSSTRSFTLRWLLALVLASVAPAVSCR